MEIKNSIFRRGKKTAGGAGTYKKAWTLRFTFTDQVGGWKRATHQFATRNEAIDARSELEAELRNTHGQSVVGDKMTFRDMAIYAKNTFYRPAVIVEGRKIAGIKSYKQTYCAIDSLIGYFGNRKIASLTRSDLDGYKAWRLKQGDRRGKKGELKPAERNPIKISTINRDLATFKHLVKFAYAEGWMSRDITVGSKAIDPDAETAKTRTLTDAEEIRLLSSCGGKRSIEYTRNGKDIKTTVVADNKHLKAVILLGLDSGMRRGEILKLEWEDIDLEAGSIRILGTHTKTQRTRVVPLTERTKSEIASLSGLASSGTIFPFNNFKRSWLTALRIAKIEGLTFHDLRRTFVTRLNLAGVSLAVAGKLAGHSALTTTQKHYVSTDDPAIIDDVRRRMDALILMKAKVKK